jgi:hypothetical protein
MSITKLLLSALAVAVTMMTPAIAGHPGRDQMAQVKTLAHRMENDAVYAHDVAERTAHHGGWAERQALSDLHRLENRAVRFHREVERRFNSPEWTEAAWQRLDADFARSQQTFRNLHAYYWTSQTFDRMASTMQALRVFYTVSAFSSRAVLDLAHQLQNAANRAHDRAEREMHHAGYWENQAIQSLHRLEDKAAHLHHQVERAMQEIDHHRNDLIAVQREMNYLDRIVPYAHFSRQVRADIARVRDLVDGLAQQYGTNACSGSFHR